MLKLLRFRPYNEFLTDDKICSGKIVRERLLQFGQERPVEIVCKRFCFIHLVGSITIFSMILDMALNTHDFLTIVKL